MLGRRSIGGRVRRRPPETLRIFGELLSVAPMQLRVGVLASFVVALVACSSSTTSGPGSGTGTSSDSGSACGCDVSVNGVAKQIDCGGSACVSGTTYMCSAAGISKGGACTDNSPQDSGPGKTADAAGACQTPCTGPTDPVCQSFGTSFASCVPVTSGGNRGFVSGAVCPSDQRKPYTPSGGGSTTLCVPSSCPTPKS